MLSPANNRSTFFNSFMGTPKSKFDSTKHRKNSTISESQFFNWSNDHMYRTSYNDMANRVSTVKPSHFAKFKSVERKNAVIPGY